MPCIRIRRESGAATKNDMENKVEGPSVFCVFIIAVHQAGTSSLTVVVRKFFSRLGGAVLKLLLCNTTVAAFKMRYSHENEAKSLCFCVLQHLLLVWAAHHRVVPQRILQNWGVAVHCTICGF